MSEIRGFRRLAPFCPACESRGTLFPAGPATAGRVNSYCRPALAPGNRLWRSPTASLAATTSSEGPAVFSARVQTPGKLWGAPPAAIWDGVLACKPAYEAGRKTDLHASAKPQTALRTALLRFQTPGTGTGGFPRVRVRQRWQVCKLSVPRYTPRSRCDLRCRRLP